MGRPGLLVVFLCLVFWVANLAGCGVGGGTTGGDYSGTYTVDLDGETFTLTITQSGNNVTFALADASGGGAQGTGTASGVNLSLNGTTSNSDTLTLELTFSDDGNSFTGTWQLGGSSPAQGSLSGTKGTGGSTDTYDVDANGIPMFATANYIELSKIGRVSRFRSGAGHDYSDSFEACRSMKHYFEPSSGVDWSAVKIYAPVTGTISGISEEWAGKKVTIKPESYPAFSFTLFHVALSSGFSEGSAVTAGQQLGTHIGPQTTSDIAVGVTTPSGWKLVSYFRVITDSVFESYQSRGIASRSSLIITKAERDADPLSCSGETFTTSGSLDDFVVLE